MELIASIPFESGSDAVNDEALKLIKDKILAEPKKILVKGYACNAPIFLPETKQKFGTNLNLSACRAMAVCNKLLAFGVPESKILVSSSYGVQESSEAERPKNRRVDIFSTEFFS